MHGARCLRAARSSSNTTYIGRSIIYMHESEKFNRCTFTSANEITKMQTHRMKGKEPRSTWIGNRRIWMCHWVYFRCPQLVAGRRLKEKWKRRNFRNDVSSKLVSDASTAATLLRQFQQIICCLRSMLSQNKTWDESSAKHQTKLCLGSIDPQNVHQIAERFDFGHCNFAERVSAEEGYFCNGF